MEQRAWSKGLEESGNGRRRDLVIIDYRLLVNRPLAD